MRNIEKVYSEWFLLVREIEKIKSQYNETISVLNKELESKLTPLQEKAKSLSLEESEILNSPKEENKD